MTPTLPTASYLMLVLLADLEPCEPSALRARAIERLAGPWCPSADELDAEVPRLVDRGLVRAAADGLRRTPAGRAVAVAWLYEDTEPDPERRYDESVLRFALLFAAAVRDAGPT